MPVFPGTVFKWINIFSEDICDELLKVKSSIHISTSYCTRLGKAEGSAHINTKKLCF